MHGINAMTSYEAFNDDEKSFVIIFVLYHTVFRVGTFKKIMLKIVMDDQQNFLFHTLPIAIFTHTPMIDCYVTFHLFVLYIITHIFDHIEKK